jgi:WD40 repeat protein
MDESVLARLITMDPSPRPRHASLTRTLVLHTGGSFWLDVTALRGARAGPLLRWLPGSPEVELGLVPSALCSLPFAASAWARALSHFHLALSPAAPTPTGASAQLAVAAAVLWYVHAARQQLPLVRPGEPDEPDTPLVVLTGSGALTQQPGLGGLFEYRVEPVDGWDDKARQLVRALAGRSVVAVHVLCPAAQANEARAAFLHALPGLALAPGGELQCRDGAGLHLHPVVTLDDVAEHVAALVPTRLGHEAPDWPALLAERYEEHRRRLLAGEDTRALDTEIRRLEKRIRAGQPLQAGDALEDGRYQLLAPVGAGSFATVWKAYDLRERELVAVKVLHGHWARDGSRVETMFRGAREMARLHHQSIARVIQDHGRHGSHHYVVMEYLPGGTLDEAVRAGRVRGRDALACVLQVGEALQYAHDKGLLHRDVKPQNVLLDRHSRARLTDFDLVRAVETAEGSRTAVVGSFVYAAPEVLVQGRPASVRSDLYSLGMTALFALYGRPLPAEILRTPEQILERIDCDMPAVKPVIARAIDIARERRYASVQEFCDALRQAQREPRQRQAYLSPVTRARRRLRQAWWAQAAVLIAAMLAGGVLARQAESAHERGRAETRRATAESRRIQDENRVLAAVDAGWQALAARQPDLAWARFWAAQELDAASGAGTSASGAGPSAHLERLALAARHGGLQRVLALPAREPAYSLAVEPNGLFLAVSGQSGTVWTWDPATGARAGRLGEERATATRLERTPDGRLLLGLPPVYTPLPSPRDRVVRIWDGQTGGFVASLPLRNDMLRSLASWAVSDRWLAACDQDAHLLLWKFDAMERLPAIVDERCGALALHRDLLAVTTDRDLALWRLDGRAPTVARRLAWTQRCCRLAFSPDGRLLAAGGLDRVEVWELARGRRVLSAPAAEIGALAFSPDGRWLLGLGRWDIAAAMWDTRSWKAYRLDGLAGRQHAPVFSPDGSLVASGSFEGEIAVWETASGTLLRRLAGHRGHVYALAFFSLGGRLWLASAGQDGTVRLWPALDQEDVRIEAALRPMPGDHLVQTLSSDGHWFATASNDGAVEVWDLSELRRHHTLSGAAEPMVWLNVSPSGRLTAASMRTPVAWELNRAFPTPRPTPLLPAELLRPDVRLMAAPDGRTVAALHMLSDRLFVLDGETLAVRCEIDVLDGQGNAMAFLSPRWLLVARFQGTPGSGKLLLVNTADCAGYRDPFAGGHDRLIAAIAVAPEHSLAATAAHDHTARLWDVAGVRERCTLRGHERPVVDVSIAADGEVVATASWDGTARLWDARTCALRHVLTGHDGHVQRVVFAPGGRLLASGGKDGTVRLWDTRTGALVTVFGGHTGSIVDLRFVKPDGGGVPVLLSLDYRGVLRRWRTPDSASGDLAAVAEVTNLRVCRSSDVVVPVVPFPRASGPWAPASACTAE